MADRKDLPEEENIDEAITEIEEESDEKDGDPPQEVLGRLREDYNRAKKQKEY